MSKSFEKWFSQQSPDRELIKPLRELNLGREEWSSSVLTLLNAKGNEDEQLSKASHNLYDCTLADANKRILQLSSEYATTHASAQGQMMITLNALKTLSMERELSSVRKAGVGTQRVLANVGSFLQSFSGVAEIVKAADQQFGGLAYGTVMVLTMVAVRKTDREGLIADVLEELGHAFPRLNVLEYLEPRKSLRDLVVGAFELAIRFCRQATEYCAGSSLRRVRDASTKDDLLKTVTRLRIKLSEIHKEVEIVMMEDLRAIRQKLHEMAAKLDNAAMEISDSNILLHDVHAQGKDAHATGEDTNLRVREGQAWMERQERSKAQKSYLAQLKKDLGLRSIANTTDAIARTTRLLEQLSDDQEQKGKVAKSLRFEDLRSDVCFWGWYRNSRSSLLVLGGHNFTDTEDDQDATSWLSYSSIWVATESLRNDDHTLCFFAKTKDAVRSHQRHTFWYIIRTFIYSLAQTLSEELMEKQEAILSKYDTSAWNDADSVEAIEGMGRLLITLLSDLSHSSTVTVVIDRIDYCQWAKFKGKGVDGMVHAVRFLVQLVRDPSLRHLRVKVLLVMSAASARNVGEKLSWAQGDQFEVRSDWDQEFED